MRIKGRICFTTPYLLIALVCCFVMNGCSPKDDTSVAKTEDTQFTIKNKGSDTMVNLAQAWAEKYTEITTTASVEVSGGGSGTGVAALINGTVDIANCSRQIKPKELELATQNTGKVPQEFIVGYDALAVYVHRDTPIDRITIIQLAEIYGENGTISKWSELGISHSDCPSDKIIRISRQSNSGTYFYFREALLGKSRDFRIGSLDLHGSKDVVEVVGRTPCAIGYSGMGYATSHVKMLEVAADSNSLYYPPNLENVLAKTYPIARPLYMYSLGEPAGEVKIYLDWILSAAGQEIVKKLGFVPLENNQK
ncbi:phosphate ABC transporter substrate-binding protein [Candidatus Poribacteria bacterium]|nr:phosphate ABC transporter substrate-binding protein [Candidatus Poribacteria bacterium]MXV84469.1 phosphate ABC transporter substrate-binding protein [Candidatus Poribacteria bacterium]MYA56142.1 phosphate ABC transporter substrate-binding protein [Candidatus Poribacteria bacterium]